MRFTRCELGRDSEAVWSAISAVPGDGGPCGNKVPRVIDGLGIMEEAENCHVGIKASSPQKMLVSLLQLQSIYTNTRVGDRQEELEAFLVILN